MMPALQRTMSRREICEAMDLAAVETELKEARSQGMKSMAMPGTAVWVEEITSAALVLLRPVKKMWLGLCFANWIMDSLPRPVVPVAQCYVDLVGEGDVLPPVTRMTLPARLGMSLLGSKGMLFPMADA